MREAIAGAGAQPLADHAAERDAAKSEPADGRVIGNGEHVARELFDGVITGGHIGCAVAADVVAQDAEVRQKRGDLQVPLAVIDAEGVRENERGAVFAALQAVVQAGSVNIGERQESTSIR